MKQLDLFTHPELEEIFAGPAGDLIEACFNEAQSPEDLRSAVKGMLNELMSAKDVSSKNQQAVYADYGIKSLGDFNQFKNNVMSVIENADSFLQNFKAG